MSSVLSSSDIARYSRHIRLPQVGMEGQEKLAKSRVLIIGMGGLGSPVALYLAAAGIGTLGLAEFDKVEAHNLQRQILHKDASVGKAKIESAKHELSALNPNINLECHPQGIQQESAVELISKYDLVVDGSDNFPTRYLVNDAAYFAKRPLVYGSIFQFEGQVSLFHPNEGGPCYRCLFPSMPEPGTVPNCEQAGVFGALCGVVGSLQSMEAIKHLLEIGVSLDGKLMVVDALDMNFRKLNLKKDPDCPLCGSYAKIKAIDPANYIFSCTTTNKEAKTSNKNMSEENPIEISVTEAKKLLEGSGPVTLIDVREDFERDICKIEPSVHIPMKTIPNELDRIPKEGVVLVHCHHGMRSMNVVQFLRQKGFVNTTNVAGGIDAWAVELDPEMNRY
jgi:adenylyltransferase/sulfurtransferase